MDHAKRPLVIPVFIPHSGCPHQCAFCNQSIITSQKSRLPDKEDIRKIAAQYYQYKGKRKKVVLAFFGGNFLGLGPEDITRLLEFIQPLIKAGKIDSIRFSTRPDTISQKTLDLVAPYNISAVELGVQSMNDEVLLKSKRGHTAMDAINAMQLLKKYPFKIGVQVMAGLPGDNDSSLFESTKKIAKLGPDFARIYPLMVLKGSLMEKWYKTKKYKPLGLEETIRLVKGMYQIFKAGDVDVIRMGLQASPMMEDKSMVLAGPWHPAFGHLVFSEILYDDVCTRIDQYHGILKSEGIVLNVHPNSESRLRGDKNINLKKLNQKYKGLEFSICRDDTIPLNEVDICELDRKTKGKWL
ncbi:MAG: radical SAM protein [Deltaproteobacteria bacterium]|nr:radical SAM protein [Deltaproteobacteria bacterium]